ncbi:hypothetical protein Pfo_031628 [Paulownia fortunei]|nr:hypothetical protein Pfo_031628 [Paulownia fortunei]
MALDTSLGTTRRGVVGTAPGTSPAGSGSPLPARRTAQRVADWRKRVEIAVLAGPAVIVFVTFVILPVALAAYYGFYKWQGYGPRRTSSAAELPDHLPGQGVPVGPAAQRLHRRDVARAPGPDRHRPRPAAQPEMRGRGLVRVLVFVPYVISEVIVGTGWSLMLQTGCPTGHRHLEPPRDHLVEVHRLRGDPVPGRSAEHPRGALRGRGDRRTSRRPQGPDHGDVHGRERPDVGELRLRQCRRGGHVPDLARRRPGLPALRAPPLTTSSRSCSSPNLAPVLYIVLGGSGRTRSHDEPGRSAGTVPVRQLRIGPLRARPLLLPGSRCGVRAVRRGPDVPDHGRDHTALPAVKDLDRLRPADDGHHPGAFLRAIPDELEGPPRSTGQPPRLLLPDDRPLSLPGVVTVGILAFIGSWNSYILPLFILNNEAAYTLPLGVQAFSSQYSVDTAKVLAFTSMSMIPALVFFTIFQKRIVGGLTGAVKGRHAARPHRGPPPPVTDGRDVATPPRASRPTRGTSPTRPRRPRHHAAGRDDLEEKTRSWSATGSTRTASSPRCRARWPRPSRARRSPRHPARPRPVHPRVRHPTVEPDERAAWLWAEQRRLKRETASASRRRARGVPDRTRGVEGRDVPDTAGGGASFDPELVEQVAP